MTESDETSNVAKRPGEHDAAVIASVVNDVKRLSESGVKAKVVCGARVVGAGAGAVFGNVPRENGAATVSGP